MSIATVSLSAKPRRSRSPAAIVFAGALLTRLCVLFLASDSTEILPNQGDMKFYSDWAQRIAGGVWTDHKAFYGLPGYAYWLALVYRVIGYQPFVVSLIQQVLEACTATLIFRLAPLAFSRGGQAREEGERRRGWLIGGLAAAGWTFCVPAQAYSLVLMPTTYLICAFWFVVWWTLRSRAGGGRPRTLAFLGLGLLMGVIAMMVANILFLVPFVLAAICLRQEWHPFPWRLRASAAGLLVGGVFIGASPCALHNHLAAGEPVFLSAHSGINFFIGNNAQANGYPLVPPPLHTDQAGMLSDSILWAEQAEGRPLKRAEVSAFWSARAHEFIAEHPGQWLRLEGTKLANFWNGFPYDDLGILTPMREEGILLPGIGFGFVAMLGLPGMLLAVWRRPRSRWVAAAVLLHMGSLMTVFVTERYRLAAVPGLLLLGSFGLVEVCGELVTLMGRWRTTLAARPFAAVTVAIYAAVFAGAVLATHRPVGRDLRTVDEFNSSVADIEKGNYDRALVKLEHVRVDVPDNAETYFAIGNAFLGKNDFDHAKGYYRRTIQLDPQHYRALNNLGVIAYQQKFWVPAEKFLSGSLAIEPNDAKTNYLLACVRVERGDRDGARAPGGGGPASAAGPGGLPQAQRRGFVARARPDHPQGQRHPRFPRSRPMKDLKLALATPPPAAAGTSRDTAGKPGLHLLAGLRGPETLLALLIAAAGIFLRVRPWAMWRQMGFDEAYYAHYLDQLLQVGLGGYPDLVDAYKLHQLTLVGSVLPPTRFLYIFCAYLWHGAFGGDALQCFYAVSRLFSVLTLGLAGLFARRLLPDGRLVLGAFALMAFSPLQIHMAQHALADGFFEFWALGTLLALWECLRQPAHKGWLTAYAAGLALMVTTKENAFFVWIALVTLIVLNRWVRFGQVSRALVVLTFVGPLVGVAVLVNLAGGLHALIDVYRIGVPKNLTLPYAIQTGDGPWYRYLLDLLTISPLVLLLAVGMALQLRPSPDSGRDDRPLLFALGFVAASYVLMCNVKYGMNLRYATMWDLPLRALAMAQIGLLVVRARVEWRAWTLTLLVAGLCAFDLYQYYRLAVVNPLYELAPADLLHALKILK